MEFYDANLNFVKGTYSNSYRGNGNPKFVLIETAPANSAHVFVVVVFDQASGTVWFDGVQLEKPLNESKEHILTDFDSVDNSSFERGGYLWGSSHLDGTVSVTTEDPWAGNQSAKMNLTTKKDAWIGTNIPVKPGEPMTLSGYVKTVSHWNRSSYCHKLL